MKTALYSTAFLCIALVSVMFAGCDEKELIIGFDNTTSDPLFVEFTGPGRGTGPVGTVAPSSNVVFRKILVEENELPATYSWKANDYAGEFTVTPEMDRPICIRIPGGLAGYPDLSDTYAHISEIPEDAIPVASGGTAYASHPRRSTEPVIARPARRVTAAAGERPVVNNYVVYDNSRTYPTVTHSSWSRYNTPYNTRTGVYVSGTRVGDNYLISGVLHPSSSPYYYPRDILHYSLFSDKVTRFRIGPPHEGYRRYPHRRSPSRRFMSGQPYFDGSGSRSPSVPRNSEPLPPYRQTDSVHQQLTQPPVLPQPLRHIRQK